MLKSSTNSLDLRTILCLPFKNVRAECSHIEHILDLDSNNSQLFILKVFCKRQVVNNLKILIIFRYILFITVCNTYFSY